MNNKILLNIYVPSIEASYNLYIPNNKKIGTIKSYVLRSIYELSDGYFNIDINQVVFIDRDTGKEFHNDMYVKDSEIKNGTKIVIV